MMARIHDLEKRPCASCAARELKEEEEDSEIVSGLVRQKTSLAVPVAAGGGSVVCAPTALCYYFIRPCR